MKRKFYGRGPPPGRQTRPPLSVESGIPATGCEEQRSCMLTGGAVGTSRHKFDRRSVATFFNEMIVRVTITGMNLMGSMPISLVSPVVGAGWISHSVSAVGERQKRIVSKKATWLISPARMLQDDSHHSYTCNQRLGRRIQHSAGIRIECSCEGPHPRRK